MILIVLMLGYGVIGLLWTAVLNSFIAYFVNTYYSKDLINYSFNEQIVDILPIFLITCIMGISVLSFDKIINSDNVIVVFIQVILGITIYVVINRLIKSNELLEIEKLFKSIVGKR